MVRTTRNHDRRDHEGEANQGRQSREKVSLNRGDESGVEGSLRHVDLSTPLSVIASEAKQSTSPNEERMDCFVASLLAMTARAARLTPDARRSPSPRAHG